VNQRQSELSNATGVTSDKLDSAAGGRAMTSHRPTAAGAPDSTELSDSDSDVSWTHTPNGDLHDFEVII